MANEIVVALITGAFGLLCAVVTGLISGVTTNKKTSESIRISQAVTDTKIEELTREVRAHNNFAQRVPVLEERMKVANHRLDDLEHVAHKGEET